MNEADSAIQRWLSARPHMEGCRREPEHHSLCNFPVFRGGQVHEHLLAAVQAHARLVALAREQDGFNATADRVQSIWTAFLDLNHLGSRCQAARLADEQLGAPFGLRMQHCPGAQSHRHTAGRVECGHCSREHDRPTQKVAYVGCQRGPVQGLGGADLLEPTIPHDGDPVRHTERFHLVVSDEQHADSEPSLKHLEVAPHALAQPGVEVAERLVQEQQAWLGSEAASQSHPLQLPPAELRGWSILEIGQTYLRQDARNPFAHRGRAYVANPQRVGDILENGHVGPDGVALEDHAHIPFVWGNKDPVLGRVYDVALEDDLALVTTFQAHDEAQRGGLAAATRTEQSQDLAFSDVEAHPFDRPHRTEVLADVRQLQNGQINGRSAEERTTRARVSRLRLGRAVSVLLLIVLLTGCAGGSSPGPTPPSLDADWGQVLAAAREEGVVAVSTFSESSTVDLQNRDFEQRYGVRVAMSVARGPDFRARWDAERAAGKPTLDVRTGGSADNRALAQAGLDADFGQLPEAADPGVSWLYDPLTDVKNHEGYTLHYAIGFMGLVVNNRLLPPEGGPRTYRELADPKYAGLILLDLPTPPGPGSRWAAYTYQQYGPEYVRAVIANTRAISTNPIEAPKQVARGEYGIYVHAQIGTLADLFQLPRPWPFRVVIPEDGQMATTSGASLLTGAPHPNAARVYLNYLLSREFEQIAADQPGVIPLRSDVTPVTSDVMPFAGRFFPGNPDTFASATGDYYALAEKTAPLLKEFGLK